VASAPTNLFNDPADGSFFASGYRVMVAAVQKKRAKILTDNRVELGGMRRRRLAARATELG